ncbi:MAG TPA: helix-turn-helix domain-containing protein [Kineosporiaceae bacterium]
MFRQLGGGRVPHQRSLLGDGKARISPELRAGQEPDFGQLVSDFLERRVGSEGAQSRLGIRLDKIYLGLVLWNSAPAGNAAKRQHPSTLQELAGQLARGFGGDSPLVAPTQEGDIWAWVSCPSESSIPPLAVLRARITPAPGVRVSAGAPRAGLDGFRRTHYAARAAAALARPVSRDVPWLHDYIDAAVTTLARDAELTRMFVVSALGDLAGSGARRATLRETLRVYLSVRGNRAHAAQILRIAPNTVTYRVAQAKKLVSDLESGDSLKLRLALELACRANISTS